MLILRYDRTHSEFNTYVDYYPNNNRNESERVRVYASQNIVNEELNQYPPFNMIRRVVENDNSFTYFPKIYYKFNKVVENGIEYDEFIISTDSEDHTDMKLHPAFIIPRTYANSNEDVESGGLYVGTTVDNTARNDTGVIKSREKWLPVTGVSIGTATLNEVRNRIKQNGEWYFLEDYSVDSLINILAIFYFMSSSWKQERYGDIAYYPYTYGNSYIGGAVTDKINSLNTRESVEDSEKIGCSLFYLGDYFTKLPTSFENLYKGAYTERIATTTSFLYKDNSDDNNIKSICDNIVCGTREYPVLGNGIEGLSWLGIRFSSDGLIYFGKEEYNDNFVAYDNRIPVIAKTAHYRFYDNSGEYNLISNAVLKVSSKSTGPSSFCSINSVPTTIPPQGVSGHASSTYMFVRLCKYLNNNSKFNKLNLSINLNNTIKISNIDSRASYIEVIDFNNNSRLIRTTGDTMEYTPNGVGLFKFRQLLSDGTTVYNYVEPSDYSTIQATDIFSITLFTNVSDNSVLNKTLINETVISGKLRSSSSIITPTITIEIPYSALDVYKYNYIYIPMFKRYYHIVDTIIITNKIIEIRCMVDVLMSWRNCIRQSPIYIRRLADTNSSNLTMTVDTEYPVSSEFDREVFSCSAFKVKGENGNVVEIPIEDTQASYIVQYNEGAGHIGSVLAQELPTIVYGSGALYFPTRTELDKFLIKVQTPSFKDSFAGGFLEFSEQIRSIKVCPIDLRIIHNNDYPILSPLTENTVYFGSTPLSVEDIECYYLLSKKPFIYSSIDNIPTISDFTDVEPYSKYFLSMPFLGTQQINSIDFKEEYDIIGMWIDIITGDFICGLMPSSVSLYARNKVYQGAFSFKGNMYCDVAFTTSANSSIHLRNAINIASTVNNEVNRWANIGIDSIKSTKKLSSLNTVGNVLGGIFDTGHNVANSFIQSMADNQPQYGFRGNIDGNVKFYNRSKISIYREKVKRLLSLSDEDEYKKTYGVAVSRLSKINDLSPSSWHRVVGDILQLYSGSNEGITEKEIVAIKEYIANGILNK